MVETFCESAIQDAIRQGKYKAVIDLQRSGNPYEISKKS